MWSSCNVCLWMHGGHDEEPLVSSYTTFVYYWGNFRFVFVLFFFEVFKCGARTPTPIVC